MRADGRLVCGRIGDIRVDIFVGSRFLEGGIRYEIEQVFGPFPTGGAFEDSSVWIVPTKDGAAAVEVTESGCFSEHMFYDSEGECCCPEEDWGLGVNLAGRWLDLGIFGLGTAGDAIRCGRFS